jgi:hypothetical protein
MSPLWRFPGLLESATWNIAGSVLAAAGALLGLIGALMMARTYYASSIWKFALKVPKYIWWWLRAKRNYLEDAVELPKANEERHVDTLVGLCQLVFGFFLQILGIACLYLGTLPDVRTGG